MAESGRPRSLRGEEYAFFGSRSTRDRLAAEARFSVRAVDEGLSFQLLGVPHHDWRHELLFLSMSCYFWSMSCLFRP